MADSPLGIPDNELREVGENNTIAGVLQNFGNRLQDELRTSLQSKITTITPKSLEQSIIFDVKFLGSLYSFELKMEDYWKFVDKGVQGVGGVMKSGRRWITKNSTSPFMFRDKKPPISALSGWSNNNGVNPFVAQRSVFHRGIKATNFYSDVVNQDLINDLIKDLEKAGAKEVEISLKNTFNGSNN